MCSRWKYPLIYKILGSTVHRDERWQAKKLWKIGDHEDTKESARHIYWIHTVPGNTCIITSWWIGHVSLIHDKNKYGASKREPALPSAPIKKDRYVDQPHGVYMHRTPGEIRSSLSWAKEAILHNTCHGHPSSLDTATCSLKPIQYINSRIRTDTSPFSLTMAAKILVPTMLDVDLMKISCGFSLSMNSTLWSIPLA